MMEDVPEDTLQTKYEDGLHPGIQVKLNSHKPTSLFEAISYAHDAEKEINSITRMLQANQPRLQQNRFNNANRPPRWSNNRRYTPISFNTPRNRNFTTTRTFNVPRNTPPTPTNFKPHRPTHMQPTHNRAPPSQATQTATPPTHNRPRIVCHRCHRFGHIAAECPLNRPRQHPTTLIHHMEGDNDFQADWIDEPLSQDMGNAIAPGGFSTYLLAMDQRTSDIVSTGSLIRTDSSMDVKNPGLGWMIAFMFAAGFLGLVAVVPLRKILIIDYKLTYPSGTATAVLINSFFTAHGYTKAQEQVRCLLKWFSLSFLFSFFKWNFSGPQGQCGFDNFPSFGFKAYDSKFFFDFNLTYVGAGMICPHTVNFSLLFGGVFSWGILWPFISSWAGDWYPADATGSNLQGLYGYKVFIAIALILGDGLYNFLNATYTMLPALYKKGSRIYSNSPKADNDPGGGESAYDDQLRVDYFVKDSLSFKMAGLCYTGLAMISMGVVLVIFEEMKWYYVLVSYVSAPILGFCNAYGCGLTNWSPISSYGKVFLFTFSYWAGSKGGVIVGLVSCGLVMVVVSSAADLMQDFKTGYLTLTSPKSMLASQVLGTVIGCLVAPATFWIFWKAFPIGKEDGDYPAPYAVIFREMALLGVQGFSSLPRHCLFFSSLFFLLAIVINLVRDCVPPRVARFVPIPMAMALPFFIGSYFAIDMCMGSIIVFVWAKLNSVKADLCIPAMASGLMCGDGVWTLFSAILALAKTQAPICMYFIASETFANLTLPSY